MKFGDIKPYIRFAREFEYKPEGLSMAALDCRIIYIRSGIGELLIGEKRRILSTGTLVYCRSGIPYGFFSEGELSVITVNFDMDTSRSHLTKTLNKIPARDYNGDDGFDAFEDAEFLNNFFVLEKATRYERVLLKLSEEFRCRKPYYAEKTSAMLKSLLADLLRDNLSSKNGEIIDVIEYVNANFRQKITNEALADMAGYHPMHLNRLFKKEVGTTVHNYVLRLRIAEAQRLLISSDLPISEIADSVGFDNATHFSTQFKKSEACAPLEYRKKYRGIF